MERYGLEGHHHLQDQICLQEIKHLTFPRRRTMRPFQMAVLTTCHRANPRTPPQMEWMAFQGQLSHQGHRPNHRRHRKDQVCHLGNHQIRQRCLRVNQSGALSVGSRRQSEYSLSRKASNESVSSTTTARSGISNGTSATSQSDRFVKAPAYDPSTLPALPPKRTKEEKDADYKKYHPTTLKKHTLKPTKSIPNVQLRQAGTTPPPPPRPITRTTTEPAQNVTIQEEQLQIEPPPRQREIAPPPPLNALLFPWGSTIPQTLLHHYLTDPAP